MKTIKLIPYSVYEIIKDLLFAIFGGFVGAVLGLYAVGEHTGSQSWYIIMFHAFVTLIAIAVARFLSDNKK